MNYIIFGLLDNYNYLINADFFLLECLVLEWITLIYQYFYISYLASQGQGSSLQMSMPGNRASKESFGTPSSSVNWPGKFIVNQHLGLGFNSEKRVGEFKMTPESSNMKKRVSKPTKPSSKWEFARSVRVDLATNDSKGSSK